MLYDLGICERALQNPGRLAQKFLRAVARHGCKGTVAVSDARALAAVICVGDDNGVE